MLIGEVATLAMVSTRAIRHYHREGILPEPARSRNGYRVYSSSDLIRLLRIRRLIGLGLPLHRIADILRDDRDDLVDELAALETDLLAQMDRIQRKLVAVRSAQASSFPEFVPLYDSEHEAIRDLWSLPEVRRVERDVGLLLLSAGSERLRETLKSGLDESSRLSLEKLGDLTRRLGEIDASSSRAEQQALITALGGILEQWADIVVEPRLTALVNDYLKQVLTASQREIITRAIANAEKAGASST